MTIGLCLITWNELEGCKKDVPTIDRTKFEQVYCIDGGSKDGTVEYLREQGVEVYRQTEKGLNQAYIDGINFSKCDAVVFYHPKGTIPPSDTYRFRELFEDGYELIVASRMMKGAHNEEDSKLIRPRKWFVLGLGLLAKVAFKREGNTVWDVLHGFKGVTVDAFNKMSISNQFTPSIDIELVSRAYKKRIKRIEFPTIEGKRMDGETHFKAWETGCKLLKYFFWELRRKN